MLHQETAGNTDPTSRTRPGPSYQKALDTHTVNISLLRKAHFGYVEILTTMDSYLWRYHHWSSRRSLHVLRRHHGMEQESSHPRVWSSVLLMLVKPVYTYLTEVSVLSLNVITIGISLFTHIVYSEYYKNDFYHLGIFCLASLCTMPPKAKAISKSTTASYTSTTTRLEPTNSHSADSDNESIIEPTQLQGSSLLNYGTQETGILTIDKSRTSVLHQPEWSRTGSDWECSGPREK